MIVKLPSLFAANGDCLSRPYIGDGHACARFNTARPATHTDLPLRSIVDFNHDCINRHRRHGIQGESDVKTAAMPCSVGRDELKNIEAFLQRHRPMGKAQGRLDLYFLTIQG